MNSATLPAPSRAFANVLAFCINRLLDLDPALTLEWEAFNGKTLALEPRGFGMVFYLQRQQDRFEVSVNEEMPYDVLLKGSPVSLLHLSFPDIADEDQLPDRVEIYGDARLGRSLEQLLNRLSPDWETPFCQLFGDVAGHQLYRLFKNTLSYSTETGQKFGRDLADYFRDELALLIHPAEMKIFLDDVDVLKDDVDRMEIKLKKAGLL